MGNKHSDGEEGFIQDNRFGLIRLEQTPTTKEQNNSDTTPLQQDLLVMKTTQMKNTYIEWINKHQDYSRIEEVLFLPV